MTKITQLDALTTQAAGDLIVIVDDVGGSPETKKISITNLFQGIPVDVGIGVAPVANFHIGGAGSSAAIMRIDYASSSTGNIVGLRFTPKVTGNANTFTGILSIPTTDAAAITVPILYDFYAANPTKGAGSTITTAYGLYVENIRNAVTNFAIKTVGGQVYFDQSNVAQAKPVVFLDQADNSEGFIDHIGASAASAVGPISTWTSGNTIQGFVRTEINGASFWMPFYDAPTS